MDNATKQFKVGTFVNSTSQDSAAFYPQYMYESVLQLATGNDHLHFNVHITPWPITFKLRRQQQTASSIFAVFVLAIAFSLLPSSMIAFICHEKERNQRHLQLISGMSLGSYWSLNFAFDLMRAFVVVGGSIGLIWHY
jgi:ATP-binding cassette, subfamily A (ABC1), member 3